LESTQKYKAAEDKRLYLGSDTSIVLYTNTSNIDTAKQTTYDAFGNWTMPGNLILNKDSVDNVEIEFLRGTGADWKILSTGNNFKIQCDYISDTTAKNYYDVITMNYNSGNLITRGSILPATNNSKQLGSTSYKWNSLYSTNVYSTTVNLNTAQNSSGGTIDFTSNKNIGSSSNAWNNLYSTNVYSTTVNLNTAQNSSGGTIDFTSNKNIGSSSNAWNNLYITNIAISGGLHFNNAARFKYNPTDRCIDVVFN
jgi:hypothetical protein